MEAWVWLTFLKKSELMIRCCCFLPCCVWSLEVASYTSSVKCLVHVCMRILYRPSIVHLLLDKCGCTVWHTHLLLFYHTITTDYNNWLQQPYNAWVQSDELIIMNLLVWVLFLPYCGVILSMLKCKPTFQSPSVKFFFDCCKSLTTIWTDSLMRLGVTPNGLSDPQVWFYLTLWQRNQAMEGCCKVTRQVQMRAVGWGV